MALTPCKPHRTFSRVLSGHKFGDATEAPTIFAPTQWALDAACAYYESNPIPPGDTDLRIDRAIHMHEVFDAEARHSLVLRQINSAPVAA